MRETYRGAIYLSAAAAIWGGMFVASKYVLDFIPPFTLLFLRYLIAGVILVGCCLKQRVSIIPRQDIGLVLQIGFVGYFLSIISQFIGTKLSAANMGAVITTLSPLFQSLFAILLLKEKMSLKQALATGLAFVGVFVMSALPSDEGGTPSMIGNLVLLLASVWWGYGAVVTRKASMHLSSLQITTCGILLAAVCSFVAMFSEREMWNIGLLCNWQVALCLFYLGFIGTAVAFFSWNKGLALVPSHQASIFFFFQPVVGTFLGWLILHENITSSFFIGTVLISAGVYLNMKIEH